jgi:hypothetical protein
MEDNWISVKEALPINMQSVLVCDNGDVHDAWYCDGCFSCGCYCEQDYENVTHWQPLPAPPKVISGN